MLLFYPLPCEFYLFATLWRYMAWSCRLPTSISGPNIIPPTRPANSSFGSMLFKKAHACLAYSHWYGAGQSCERPQDKSNHLSLVVKGSTSARSRLFSFATSKALLRGTIPICFPSTEINRTVFALICALTLTAGFLLIVSSCKEVPKVISA